MQNYDPLKRNENFSPLGHLGFWLFLLSFYIFVPKPSHKNCYQDLDQPYYPARANATRQEHFEPHHPTSGNSIQKGKLHGSQPSPANLSLRQHPYKTKQMSIKILPCNFSHGSENLPPHTPRHTHPPPNTYTDTHSRELTRKRRGKVGGGKSTSRESRSVCSGRLKKVGWISPKPRSGTSLQTNQQKALKVNSLLTVYRNSPL